MNDNNKRGVGGGSVMSSEEMQKRVLELEEFFWRDREIIAKIYMGLESVEIPHDLVRAMAQYLTILNKVRMMALKEKKDKIVLVSSIPRNLVKG